MIRGYLRHRRVVFALYGIVLVTFPGITLLYGESLAPVGYALLIVTFLLCVGIAVDYARFSSRTKALDAVLENLSDAAHALPEAVGPIEQRYHALAKELYTLLENQKEGLMRHHGEQLDYYTMWVHQIKTPIAAMRLALEGGARRDVLEAELFKVERYVEMALQFVKIGDLSGDLVITEYSLPKIVSACVKKYAPLFIGKHLSIDIEGVKGEVTTDSKWLSFIIQQLLSNAIKYTNHGGVKMFSEGSALIVEDTGIGIRQEDIARIFHKGYTGYNGRMDQRASGLGLFMSRKVADQLSIRIYAESTLGKGTRMTLVFPRKDIFLQ